MITALEEKEEKMKGVQWRTHADVMQPCEDVVRNPSQWLRSVVVCVTTCCAARGVIPGNGAMDASRRSSIWRWRLSNAH